LDYPPETILERIYINIRDLEEHWIFPAVRSKGGIVQMHPADVDGDGDKDIMAAFSVTTEMNPALTPTSRNRQDKLVWFENRDGVFSEQKIISTKPNGLYDTQAGDLDGDGRPDAISVEFSSSRIAMFPNLGQGNWGEAQIVMQAAGSAVTDCGQCIGKGPNAAYVADLNGDGKNDMLFATYPYGGHGGSAVISGSQVGWIENLGGGNWGSPQLINITSGGSINSVSATDVDADGDMDVLVTSSTQGQMLAWFENNGDGTFKELDVISEDAQHSGWVVLADMDGDGDADVLSLHESPDMGHKVEGEAIVWFENLATADNGRPDIAFDKQHKLLICGEEHTEKEALALPAEACPEPTEAPDEDTAMMDSRTLASRLALVVPTVVWFSMS
jgi:hypothetical protein